MQFVSLKLHKEKVMNLKEILISTGTKTARGGTAIYVKSTHHTIERNDLKICNKEYESTWIEILNQKCKNVVIGCIYRHPHYDNLDDFNSYVKNLFLKLNKENKEVYICGNVNINLLKYDDEIVVQDFYNLMNSNGNLPQVNLPTRITTMTFIDNIFTNTMNYNSFSDKILIQIADHLSQFLPIDTSKIEYKKLDIYKRDYSNFNEQSLLKIFQSKIGIMNMMTLMIVTLISYFD